MEVWTELKGKTKLGKYYVSNTGKVKKVYKSGKETILKNSVNTYGYLYFGHHVVGESKMKYVHRIVAELYVPNPDNKTQVDHIDKNKLNNHYTNLRWASNSENSCHRKRNKVGKFSKLKGVSKNGKYPKFKASICVKGKKIFLGYFDTDVEAHEAYCAKAKELHGEFASFV